MTHVASVVDRLPARVRVTLAFSVVMALLLIATGGFLYLRLGATPPARWTAGCAPAPGTSPH